MILTCPHCRSTGVHSTLLHGARIGADGKPKRRFAGYVCVDCEKLFKA